MPDAHQRFVELLERHRGIVFRVASTYAWQPDDRDDLAQEITAQLWRAFPQFDGQRPFPTWMYRIALNVAISHTRSRGHRDRHLVPLDEQLHDVADEHGSDPALEMQVGALRRFIAALAPLDRALMLLYLDECSYREIADVLGLSETNVAAKIGRLKQRIRTGID